MKRMRVCWRREDQVEIKNCNGRRIKSCDKCDDLGTEVWGGGISCRKTENIIVSLSFEIPFICPLPNWKRTLEVKLE